jgi:hypothetical protein
LCTSAPPDRDRVRVLDADQRVGAVGACAVEADATTRAAPQAGIWVPKVLRQPASACLRGAPEP